MVGMPLPINKGRNPVCYHKYVILKYLQFHYHAVEIDEGVVMQLVSMGFEPAKARHASAEAQGDMDRALAVLVDACGDEDGAAEAPRAPAAVEAAATTSARAGTVPVHDSQWNGEWDMLVAELMEMGFDDAVACRASLAEHEGDLKGAVKALVVRERQGGAFI